MLLRGRALRLEDEAQGDCTGLGPIRPEISGPEKLSVALEGWAAACVCFTTITLLAIWGGSSPAKGTN